MNLNVQISWQAQYFVNLDVQISWQARYIVNFEMLLCTRLCALRFVLVCALTFVLSDVCSHVLSYVLPYALICVLSLVLVNLDVQMFLKGFEFQSVSLYTIWGPLPVYFFSQITVVIQLY